MLLRILVIPMLGLLLFGCSTTEVLLYETPPDLKDQQLQETYIQKATQTVRGYTVFLDPGHGGEDRRGRGFADLAVEADVNLRVALHLKEFMQAAGISVLMSRTVDETVSLNQRSEMANKSGADFFISIHHNAPGKSEDRYTNYTSTYYHGTDTSYVYEPSEQDLARYIQRDLAYVMRLPGGLGSFDGTYSDYWIYPGDGFSVLRKTTIPAVLIEGSFFTHPEEEKRLAQDEFNKIQAWGIFKGFVKYIAAGIPRINFSEIQRNNNAIQYVFTVESKTPIKSESIRVWLNKEQHDEFTFDKRSKTITVTLSSLSGEEVSIKIVAANQKGNHTLPFHYKARLK